MLVSAIMNKFGKKDFSWWIVLKEKLHKTRRRPRTVSEGDIWWCAVGENVGVEINGKGHLFARPVLVLTKFGKYSFMGIPLTSQSHTGSWYVPFEFKNKQEIAVLAQVETISVSRLYRKMGTVPESDLQAVLTAFISLVSR